MGLTALRLVSMQITVRFNTMLNQRREASYHELLEQGVKCNYNLERTYQGE